MAFLTDTDQEAISALLENKGYHALISILDNSIEVVADALLKSEGKSEKKLLAYWRALKHISDVLRETPHSIQEILKSLVVQPVPEEFQTNMDQAMKTARYLEQWKQVPNTTGSVHPYPHPLTTMTTSRYNEEREEPELES